MNQSKMTEVLKKLENAADAFSENTPVYQYLRQLENTVIEKDPAFKEKYETLVLKKDGKQKDVFLSVVMRTQGKRPLGLREALLSLNAQTNQNFELIIIAHKATDENLKKIKKIIEEQDKEFKEKIRFFELNEGTRTAPINFGFAVANGKYVSVFDDDDILFDNWVESFAGASRRGDGSILHSFAFAQMWKRTTGKNYEEGYLAVSAPDAIYCSEFKLLEQLVVNKCPLMTLAFPAVIFKKLGIVLNESLNVTEDWEYFMRTAFLFGVVDVEQTTAIYRFWENVEASITLHDEQEWLQTYRSIQSRFNSNSIILPKGNIKTIIELIEGINNPIKESAYPRLDGKLYYSKGSPFNDLECLNTVNKEKEPAFDLLFIFNEKYDDIKALRIDLCERGFWVLKDIEIIVWLSNGEKEIVPIHECVHNGIDFAEDIVFINTDPEIIFEWNDQRTIDVVHITGKIDLEIPNLPFLKTSFKNIKLKQYINRWKLHKKNLF